MGTKATCDALALRCSCNIYANLCLLPELVDWNYTDASNHKSLKDAKVSLSVYYWCRKKHVNSCYGNNAKPTALDIYIREEARMGTHDWNAVEIWELSKSQPNRDQVRSPSAAASPGRVICWSQARRGTSRIVARGTSLNVYIVRSLPTPFLRSVIKREECSSWLRSLRSKRGVVCQIQSLYA